MTKLIKIDTKGRYGRWLRVYSEYAPYLGDKLSIHCKKVIDDCNYVVEVDYEKCFKFGTFSENSNSHCIYLKDNCGYTAVGEFSFVLYEGSEDLEHITDLSELFDLWLIDKYEEL